jgi:GH24 family phage-related lysozyme (muramidase)
MLLIKLHEPDGEPGRSCLSLFDADSDSETPFRTYWAEGAFVGGAFTASQTYILRFHRLNTIADINMEDVRLFGRYGIVTLSDHPFDAPLSSDAHTVYISGGKQADNNPRLGPLLRLSAEDHRDLCRLIKLHDNVHLEASPRVPSTNAPTSVVSHYSETTVLQRLVRRLPSMSLPLMPFILAGAAHAQCTKPPYDSGSGYSGYDPQQIQTFEGNETTGYIPSSKSGVTIGIGVDLSAQTNQGLVAMGVPQALADQFDPYYGLTGAQAQAALAANPLTITDDEAASLNNAVLPAYANQVAQAFDNASPNMNFSDLNVQWQTSILSMYYNGGSKIFNTQYWQQVTNGEWSAALANLANFEGPSVAQNKLAANNAAYLTKSNCTDGTTNGG